MVNWSLVKQVVGNEVVRKFSSGSISGRTLTSLAKNTKAAGEVRFALREHGVEGSRRLAKRSLSR